MGNIGDGVEIYYMDLHKALQIGDWNATKEVLNRHPHGISAIITGRGKTVLHVATNAGQAHIVEELVKQMSEDNLEIKDIYGYTALAQAAYIGNYRIAECMLEKNEKLISIGIDNGSIPVVLALFNGHLKLGRYLYSLTPLEILMPENGTMGASIVSEAIYNKALDIALDLLRRCPRLFLAKDRDGESPLYALAGMPDCFQSGNRLAFWKRWIYSGMKPWVSSLGTLQKEEQYGAWMCATIERFQVHYIVKNKEDYNRETSESHYTCKLDCQICKENVNVLIINQGIEHLYEMKLAHFQSRELLSQMKDQMLILNNEQRATGKVEGAVLRAVKEGIFEFVFDIVKVDPTLVFSSDSKTANIFSVAVQYRHAKIFSLIYGLDDIKSVLTSITNVSYGNNLLHMAGILAPSTSLYDIPGAALQMQRELQWFKEVESIVPPKVHACLNDDGLTPREFFTENHKDMRKDGEKWMKDTATSCTVVGALIITIMFAAVFTVPEEDFLESLPRKMILGLSTLFFSIAAMMTAFSAALFLMLHEQSWIFKPVICLASIPITLFVLMQFPLLVAMANSTYGPSIFDRKMKRWF
ncbi:hypothetical protein SO802_009649 [Lithocarpus litseifolius]|uniref:PGG domain-containing protein n=1 Tax=Lithocarpus litseifolius TaxID=425828 RepID=A0AAW2DE57_9ROSI